MNNILKACATSILGLSLSFAANAVIIDFEGALEQDQNNTGGSVTPYPEDGFILTSDSPNDIFGNGSGTNDNGTNIFGLCGHCSVTPPSLTLQNGGVFSLISMDISSLNIGESTSSLLVTGFVDGGGVVATFIDPVVDVWETIFFSGFTDLNSLTVSATSPSEGNLAFDNIVLSTEAEPEPASVPEPASLALLGLGLAGLGFSRRKVTK